MYIGFCFFSVSFICCAISATWDYNDVSQWTNLYPECGESHQSPIDIMLNHEQSECKTPLTLSLTSETARFAIRNKQHSLQAIPFEISYVDSTDITRFDTLYHRNDTNIRLQNIFYDTYKSAINSEYCFDSLHFHWGINNEHGSEHTLNGNQYPLEMHLIHYSCDYYTITDALSAYTNGELTDLDDDNVLAVIAVLFEIGEPNPVLAELLNDVIIDGVQSYDVEDEQLNIMELFYAEFNPMDLLPQNKEFIGYQGSFTVPPCYETVRWHVLKERMTVSEEQMQQFRLLLSSTNTNDSIAPNWRPVQQLGERTVYQCNEEIDAHKVQKEVSETDADEAGKMEDGERWFIIAVIFICLFAAAALHSTYLSYILHCNKKSAYQDLKLDSYGTALAAY